ncbi:uncharacterized protein [Ambystoma mexicanum]|uniref:uncharacterized protein n=1 Tax=Ambystoma mexicanum TaxID=8296 RepID=UPI0037E8E02F
MVSGAVGRSCFLDGGFRTLPVQRVHVIMWRLVVLLNCDMALFLLSANATSVLLNKLSLVGKQQHIDTESMAALGTLDSIGSAIRRLRRTNFTSMTDRKGHYPILIQESDIFAEVLNYQQENKGRNTMLNFFRLHASSTTHHSGSQLEDEAEEDFMAVVTKPAPKAKLEKKLAFSNPKMGSGLEPLTDKPEPFLEADVTDVVEGSGNIGRKGISGQDDIRMTNAMGTAHLDHLSTEVQGSRASTGGTKELVNILKIGPPNDQPPSSEDITTSSWQSSPASDPGSSTGRGIRHVNNTSVGLRKVEASAGSKKTNPSLSSGNLQASIDVGEKNTNNVSTSCNPGYVLTGSLCKSVCEINPAYCHNRGKCLILENIGPLCRCIQKDYVWYKGDRCESYLTDLQLNGIIIGCCLLVSVLLLLFPLLLMKTHSTKPAKKSLGSTSKLWISSLMPHMNLSFSTLSEASDATERTLFDTLPRLSTFFDVEKNQVTRDSVSRKTDRTLF